MKKNENERVLTKFAEKKGLIDILKQTFSYVEGIKRDCCKDYRIVGKETEQAIDRNGELRWEDDAKTKPYYRDKWGYVDVPIEDMSDEIYAKYKACDVLIKSLEALI